MVDLRRYLANAYSVYRSQKTSASPIGSPPTTNLASGPQVTLLECAKYS